MRWSADKATTISPLRLWGAIALDLAATVAVLCLFGLPWPLAIAAGALLVLKQELALSYLTNTMKKLPPWVQS